MEELVVRVLVDYYYKVINIGEQQQQEIQFHLFIIMKFGLKQIEVIILNGKHKNDIFIYE